jgi:hypothetical protein
MAGPVTRKRRRTTTGKSGLGTVSKEYLEFKVLFEHYHIHYTIVRGYLFARCPYHGPNLPIASVPRNGCLYSCMACRWDGTPVDFVKRHERLRSNAKASERLSEILQSAASRGKGAGS